MITSKKQLKASFNQNNATKVAYNTVTQFAGRFIILLFGLISVSVLTRYLGVSNYGRFAVITAYLTFFYTLSDWGITALVTRESARKPEEMNDLVSTSFRGRLLYNIPLTIVAILIAQVIYPHDSVIKIGILITSSNLFINVVITSLMVFFQVNLRNDLTILAEALNRIVNLSLVLIAVHYRSGIYILLIASVIGYACNAGLLYTFARKKGFGLHLRATAHRFKKMFVTSIPLGLALLIGSIYFKVDTILLSVMKPPFDVGIYAVAYRVLEIILIFPTVFGTTIFPLLSRYHSDKDRLVGLLTQAFKYLFIFGFPVLVGGMILSKPVVNLISGSSYMLAVRPLKILLVSVLISFFNTIMALTMIATDQQKKTLYVNIAVLTLNIALNLIFIPRFSYIGAAFDNLASELMVLGIYAYFIYKQFGWLPRIPQFGNSLGAGLVMGGVVVWLGRVGVNLLINVMVGVLVYGLASLVLKVIRIAEIKELFNV